MRTFPAVVALVASALPSFAVAQTAIDPAKIEVGAITYHDFCATCHGDQLRNTGGSTFDLRRLRPENQDRFVTVVLDGKGQMPPWRGVLEMDQIESIWAYIRATIDR